jgi:hypothetical protein
MISRSIHFSANDIISLISIVYTYHTFFIHSLVYRYLGWFPILAIVSNAIININMDMQVFQLYVDLHSFRYMPKNGIADHMAIISMVAIIMYIIS